MTINHKITHDGDAFLHGTVAGITKLKGNTIKVAFPATAIDFMYLLEMGDEFCTYGPVGGDNTVYHAIQWAYETQEAFGVQIDDFSGKNYPVILLSSHGAARDLARSLGEKLHRKM